MRCYHINNFYLIGVQAGIQSAHAQHEMAAKYLASEHGPEWKAYHQTEIDGYVEWMKNHKTIIVLNGGMQEQLEEWVTFLKEQAHSYAWAPFYEAKEALNGALTNIALVLPEHIYKYARFISTATAAWSSAKSIDTYLKNDCTHVYLEPREDKWALVTEMFVDDDNVTDVKLYSNVDVELMAKLSKCSLM